MPPLPCHELRGLGKTSKLPFSTSDPTGNFPPSLISAFHSPGPGATRCHWIVTKAALWCKPDHPILASPRLHSPQKVNSQHPCSPHFSVNTCCPKIQQMQNAPVHLAGPHKILAPTDPSVSAALRGGTGGDISHTNVPVWFANLSLISTAWGQAAANAKCCLSRFFCMNYTELPFAWHRKWSHKFYFL